MTGHAHFTAIDQHIRNYYEQGIYTTKEGEKFPFDQSFRYVIKSSHLQIYRKNFSNNQFEPLHIFNFQEISENVFQGQHIHKCKNDQYDCHFNILKPSNLEIFYTVKGPNKKYSTHTTLNKIVQN